jgi:hypothetical protein
MGITTGLRAIDDDDGEVDDGKVDDGKVDDGEVDDDGILLATETQERVCGVCNAMLCCGCR